MPNLLLNSPSLCLHNHILQLWGDLQGRFRHRPDLIHRVVGVLFSKIIVPGLMLNTPSSVTTRSTSHSGKGQAALLEQFRFPILRGVTGAHDNSLAPRLGPWLHPFLEPSFREPSSLPSSPGIYLEGA